ncbi:MAG: nuclear transport factor 2 family protein [Pseudomonadota bacterium]
MTLSEIAAALVDGCRSGEDTNNLPKLYAPDAVSVEAVDFDGSGREVSGIAAIQGKHEWWNGAFEVLEQDISDPYPHGDDRFAVRFRVKTRDRSSGAVDDMDEIGIYHVADGKIVREEFFYALG